MSPRDPLKKMSIKQKTPTTSFSISMIKQPAKVIAETASTYLLETLPQSACARCEAGNGCGGGILAQAFANKTFHLSIAKTRTLHIDELVQIGIQSSVLIRGSFLLYLLPLVLMVTGALLMGSLTMNQDVYTVSGAVVGLLLGSYFGRSLSNYYFNSGKSTPILIDDDNNDSCWYNAS